MKHTFITVAVLILLAVAFRQAWAYGPYDADLVRVLDGDTVQVDVRLWPGLAQRINLRVNGIDTPEKRTRNLCEKEKGLAATAYAEQMLAGAELTIDQIALGKYAGRVLGALYVDGVDFGAAMIEAGHARPYDGGTRQEWCP